MNLVLVGGYLLHLCTQIFFDLTHDSGLACQACGARAFACRFCSCLFFLLALCFVSPDSGALHDVVNISALDSQASLHWTITMWDPIWDALP